MPTTTVFGDNSCVGERERTCGSEPSLSGWGATAYRMSRVSGSGWSPGSLPLTTGLRVQNNVLEVHRFVSGEE